MTKQFLTIRTGKLTVHNFLANPGIVTFAVPFSFYNPIHQRNTKIIGGISVLNLDQSYEECCSGGLQVNFHQLGFNMAVVQHCRTAKVGPPKSFFQIKHTM